MAGNIKGITIEIDGNTTKLDRALKSTESNTKSVNMELKQVNSLLKLNPGNTDLIAQKQALLAKQVQNTSDKLQTLKSAQAQVEAQFASGDLGEDEYRAFQREVVATEGKLKSYQGQLSASKSAQSNYANSVNQLQTLFKATGTSVESFRSVLGDKLTNAIKNGTASSKQLDSAFKQVAEQSGVAKSDISQLASAMGKFDGTPAGLKQTTAELDKLSQKSETSSKTFGSFKEKLSLGAVAGAASSAVQSVTGGLGDLVQQGVEASDSMDKFKSTMKFAGLGDAEINKASAAVKTYADQTVYELGDVSNMTAQLAANGIKDYTGLTQAAGNLNAVAGGNADTFKSVGMVMTQTAGAGKLTTENWNQLADAIPGASGKLQEAMKKNGAYTGNFRDAMEKGEISSDEFNAAVKQLGMNDGAVKAAKSTSTFEGAIGNLQANVVSGIQDIINSIGKANLTQMISTLSNGVVGALKIVVAAIKAVATHADTFKVLATAVGAFFLAFKGMTMITSAVNAVKDFGLAMKLLGLSMSAGPWGIAIAAIAAIVAALVVFFTKTKAGQAVWKGFVDFLKNAWNAIKDTASTVFNAIGNTISTVFNTIGTVITTVWTAITTTLSTIWNGIVAIASPIFNTIKNVITVVFMTIQSVIQGVWTVITSVLSVVWNGIVALAQAVWTPLTAFFSSVWNGVQTVVTTVWNAIMAFLTPIWNALKTSASTIFNAIKTVISTVWNAISSVTSSVWNAIKSVISSVWNGIKSVVSSVVNSVKSTVSSVWNAIKSVTTSVWNAIKSAISGPINAAKSLVSSVVNGIKSTVSNVWNGIRSVTSSVWNGIKSAIEGPINAAKNTVSRVINAIKGFFSGLHLSLPKINMPSLPHFKFSGKFSLNPPSVPHLGVDWYATGGIMTKPTIFGAGGSNLMGGGEAGNEAVLPLNEKNLSVIGAMIAKTMGSGDSTGVTNALLQQVSLVQEQNKMLSNLLTAVTNGVPAYIDLQDTARKITPYIASEQETANELYQRGRGIR